MLRKNICLLTRSMSKSKKQLKPVAEKVKAVAETGPVTLDKAGNILIRIQAKPGSKSNKITNIDEDSVGVQISARPVDGEANSELLKYLQTVLNVKKSEISLDKGSKSRQKTLIISSSDYTIDKVIAKLKEEMKME